MSVTIAHKDGKTLTFRDGNMVISPPSREPMQIKSESEDATVRIANIATQRKDLIKARIQFLQKDVEGGYNGFDDFVSLLENTLDYSSATLVLTDADGDSWTVRYWEPVPFELDEHPKSVFSGEVTFRVEAADSGVYTSPVSSLFLRANGSVPLTANWDAGDYQIRARQFYADGAADAGGILLGDSTQLWQSAADTIYTPDSFTSAATIQAEHLYSTDDLEVDGLIDLGTNTISDGSLVGDWTVDGDWTIGANHYLHLGGTNVSIYPIAPTDLDAVGTTTKKRVSLFAAQFQASNRPPGGANYFSGIEFRHNLDDEFAAQLAFGTFANTEDCLWIRTEYYGSRDDWQKVVTSEYDGSLASLVNVTAAGTVQAEHLYSTDDILALDDITSRGNMYAYGGRVEIGSQTYGSNDPVLLMQSGAVGAASYNSSIETLFSEYAWELNVGNTQVMRTYRYHSPTQLGFFTEAVIINDSGNLTATGTVQAEHLYSTDDLEIDGLATIGETLTVTGDVEFDAAFNHDGATFGALGATPAAQQAHLADPTDLAECIARISSILDYLETFGFVATS